jgi:hypothetical protein
MTEDQMMMLLRMLLQMAGTFLVAHGVFGEADWTTLAGVVVTLAPMGWSFWARRESGLKSTVGAMPNTVVVTTAPVGVVSPATDTPRTAALASKIAAMPEVTNVISTPEIAASTPSPKVVS